MFYYLVLDRKRQSPYGSLKYAIPSVTSRWRQTFTRLGASKWICTVLDGVRTQAWRAQIQLGFSVLPGGNRLSPKANGKAFLAPWLVRKPGCTTALQAWVLKCISRFGLVCLYFSAFVPQSDLEHMNKCLQLYSSQEFWVFCQWSSGSES